jgi:hypothetical protein
MTTRSGFEDTVAALMHIDASVAMKATDTEYELSRLQERHRHDAARRRRVVLAVAACVVAAAVAVGLVARPSTHTPPAEQKKHGRALHLDEVPAPRVEVRPVALPLSSAPVALSGLGRIDGIAPEEGGRLWVLSSDRGTQEWTLERLGPDRRTVEVSVRFAAAPSLWGSPWATVTDDVIVLALSRGGPLPAAARFVDRRDGLLRLDRRSGRVLGFTPVDTATTVEAAADGTVWAVVSPDRVANIDPVTGRTLRTVKTPGLVDRALVQGDRLWLTYMQASPTPAWQLDARSGRVLHTATTDDQAIDVAVGDAVLLVHRDGRVLRVERDGQVSAAQLVLPGAGQVTDLTADGEDLWLWVDRNTLVRVDAATLAPRAAITLPWNGPYSLMRDGADLLVSSPEQGTVRRIPASALTGPGT